MKKKKKNSVLIIFCNFSFYIYINYIFVLLFSTRNLSLLVKLLEKLE